MATENKDLPNPDNKSNTWFKVSMRWTTTIQLEVVIEEKVLDWFLLKNYNFEEFSEASKLIFPVWSNN